MQGGLVCDVTANDGSYSYLYTITRLNKTDCNIGGCGKIGTHGNKLLVDQKYVRYKYVPYQYTEYYCVTIPPPFRSLDGSPYSLA